MKAKEFIGDVLFGVFIVIPNIPTFFVFYIYAIYHILRNNPIQEIVLNREDVLDNSLKHVEKVFTEVLFSSIALIFWLSIITIYVF